ncbi:MAG: ATP-binding protein [Gammaproteobacteria bacterium]|nr:ATP-binding protein [Gammaproteobacteria bacterium]
MTRIIDAYLGLSALRQAGYRSTATAVAELVDNSIEAQASDIDIIAISRATMISKRSSNQVESIAVLDNGEGMPPEILSQCLSLGWGTRLSTRKGLGRFGFGLKGSSISQARRVDVYSWIEPEEVYHVYLDLDEIKEQKVDELPLIEKTQLPEAIKKCFLNTIGPSGTLVYWSRLDQIDLKRPETLLSRVNADLCRIYRHFLDDCDQYGAKRNIRLRMLQDEKQSITNTVPLGANDPLYLLTPNNLEGFSNEATNVMHSKFSIDVKYDPGNGVAKTSEVQFRFSIAKPSVQNLGGNSLQGKHYGKNTGISFVRAGREIDFGSFGFTDSSEPRHRWWGAEIRFEPVLDELFGVTNNKQEVRGVRKLEQELRKELAEGHNEDNYRVKLLLELDKILTDNISQMMRIIKGRREGERKQKENRGLTKRVNEDISKSPAATESEERAKNLTHEQKLEERVKLLLNDDSSMEQVEALQIAENTIEYRVDLQTDDWPGYLFLDRKPVANASVGIVNRNSKFYEDFWLYLEEHSDRKGFEALEILIMALVRAEDELVREYDREVFERYRQLWGTWVEKLIKHAGS